MTNDQNTFRKKFDSILNRQKLLWSILTGSVFLLVLLTYGLNSRGVNIDAAKNTDLNFILFPAAAVVGIMSFLLKKYLTSNKFTNRFLGSIGKNKDEDLFESERETKILMLAKLNYVPLTIQLASNLVITDLGFFAAIISNDAEQILPYALISTMLNLMLIPSAYKIESKVPRTTYP